MSVGTGIWNSHNLFSLFTIRSIAFDFVWEGCDIFIHNHPVTDTWLRQIMLLRRHSATYSRIKFGNKCRRSPAMFLPAERAVSGRITGGRKWLSFACYHLVFLERHILDNSVSGFLTTILSWKFLVPYARLTYTVYLIHPVILAVFYGSREQTLENSSLLKVSH